MKHAIQLESMDQKKKMNKWLKWTLIILAILAVIIIGLLIYVNAYIDRSLAQTEGTVSLNGLEEEVTVVYDEVGVPHIQATNDLDLFYAQGYITAQDRIFQMELSRRQASGQLSEVIGESMVEQDKYFRTLGLRRAAEKSLEIYDEESLNVLQAYAYGVNAYIEQMETNNSMPAEFKLAGLSEISEWTPLDSLTIGKFMAFDLGGHWERQAFNYYLMNHFDEEVAYELFPTYPENGPTNILEEEYVDVTASLSKAVMPHEFNGSNNWAVSGEKTKSGSPLLSDDPHLGLSTPSIWYQSHLESPNYNVSGVIFAGVPGIILGHNDHVAWGVTNVGPDVQQLYLERRHENDPAKFEYDGEWYEADVITETIHVDGQESIDYEVTETIHGPVISEFANGVEEIEGDTVLSVDWTALEATTELKALLEFNQATNWKEFEKALEGFHAPAQNFMFASKDGTIAYKANGKIPIYENPDDALLPMPGWDSQYTLDEFIPFDELPTVVNPDKNFIATANNKVIDDSYPYHISHVWAQPYRYSRIEEYLASKDDLTAEDMMELQMDQKNKQAELFVPIFLDVLGDQADSPAEEQAIKILADWDFEDHKDEAGPLIFHTMLKKIEENLYADEIPEEVRSMFKGMGQTTDQLILQSYDGEELHWIEQNGGLDQLLSNSFSETIQYLTDEYGESLNEWKWGDYHQIYFAHNLSGISFLERFFNPDPPQPLGGSGVTVMAARGKEDGIVNHGAGWRFVNDLADPNSGYHIVGPGQSEHYRSDYYQNQLDDWIKGNYHETRIDNYSGDQLTLEPK